MSDKYAVIQEDRIKEYGHWVRDSWTIWDTTDSPRGSDVVDQLGRDWERDQVEKHVRGLGYVIETVQESDRRHALVTEARDPGERNLSDVGNNDAQSVDRAQGKAFSIERVKEIVGKISESLKGDSSLKASFDDRMQTSLSNVQQQEQVNTRPKGRSR